MGVEGLPSAGRPVCIQMYRHSEDALGPSALEVGPELVIHRKNNQRLRRLCSRDTLGEGGAGMVLDVSAHGGAIRQ